MDSARNQKEATSGSGDEVELEGYVEIEPEPLLADNEGIPPPGETSKMSNAENSMNDTWTTHEDNQIKPTGRSRSPEIVPDVSMLATEGAQSYEIPKDTKIQVWITSSKQAEEVSKLGVTVKFTSYMIRCRTSLSSYSFHDRTVWRRFKDFDAFRQLLRVKYPGYFCPPLPQKHYINSVRAKEEFIEMRRLDLEKFLRRIVCHEAWAESNETKLFLGSPEELAHTKEWIDLLQANNIKKPGASLDENGLAGAKMLLKKDVRNTLWKVGKTFKRDSSKSTKFLGADEQNLKQITSRLKEYHDELAACWQRSRALMTVLVGTTAEMLQMGKAFVGFARFEEKSVHTCGQYTATGRAAALNAGKMQKTGYTTLRVHQIYQKFSQAISNNLSAVEDQLLLIPCALEGLRDREAIVEKLQDGESSLEDTRQRLSEVTRDAAKKIGGKATYTSKSAQLSRDINTMVEDLGNLYKEHDDVKNINIQEAEKLSRQRNSCLHAMVIDLAKTQKHMHESLSEAWTMLAEQLDGNLGPSCESN